MYKSLQSEENEENGLKSDSLIERLVKKVFAKYDVTNVIANSRICQAFKTKMWRMTRALEKAVRAGERQIKNLKNSWTKGRNSTWTFKIHYSDLSHVSLDQQLKGENRKLEEMLQDESRKKAKLEQLQSYRRL